MVSPSRRHTVAIVGAGAAGALVAIHVCEAAARRHVPLDLVLIDPAPEAGRGAAYATTDPRHRLNVPAGGMSCYPDDPKHFVRWLCHHGEPDVTPADFATRYRFGAYLADTLGQAITRAHKTVAVRRLRTKATRCTWTGSESALLHLADGRTIEAGGVVLATGPAAARCDWASEELRASGRLIADPWAPGALDAVLADDQDVLLVGSGLTAVDLAVCLERPGRTVHAVSRGGRLPRSHVATPLPPVGPGALSGLPLPLLRTAVHRHLVQSLRTHGDWRPALDGLRPLTQRLWAGLSDAEKAEFLARDRPLWNIHRHRMPPKTAALVTRALAARRLRLHTGEIGRASMARSGTDGALEATLTGERVLRVGWVVNCTGTPPRMADAADPLWQGLLADGTVLPDPLGIGVMTREGRLRAADGRADRAFFTLGSPRRGELWETTAVPEIRAQAAAIADALLAPRMPPPSDGRQHAEPRELPLSVHAPTS